MNKRGYMNRKLLAGYLISALGIIALALTSDHIKLLLNIKSLPGILTESNLTIVGVIMVTVGVLIAWKLGQSSVQAKEVPIFEGNKVVGYRRHK